MFLRVLVAQTDDRGEPSYANMQEAWTICTRLWDAGLSLGYELSATVPHFSLISLMFSTSPRFFSPSSHMSRILHRATGCKSDFFSLFLTWPHVSHSLFVSCSHSSPFIFLRRYLKVGAEQHVLQNEAELDVSSQVTCRVL